MSTVISIGEVSGETASPDFQSLPRRDYIILPLVSLATVLLMLTVSEIGTRIFWPQVFEDSCLIHTSGGDAKARANCTSTVKAAEGLWSTNRYNECGYRTDAPCGAKPAGALRVALIGASTTQGAFVPYDQTFATRMGVQLAADLKRPVQIENLSIPHASPLDCYHRVTEAITLEPDVIIFPIAPDDLQSRMDPERLAQRDNPNAHFAGPSVAKKLTAVQRLHQWLIQESTAVVIAQHYLFENTDTAVRIFLASGDKSDFVRQPFTAAWDARFADLQILVNDMALRLRARGIPLVLVAIPSRVEAALLKPQYRQPHVDAFAFGNRIHEMAAQNGATFVDLIRPLSQLARPEDLYFVVNLHPTGEGHGAIARELTPAVEQILISRVNRTKQKN